MTNLEIKTTLESRELKDESLTIAFRRYISLPDRVRHNIKLGYYLETGYIDFSNYLYHFFSNMTEDEYITYMKNA